MRTRYRKRRDRFLTLLGQGAPTAHHRGISAGLRVLVELPPNSPPATEIAERARSRSISLFPIGRCYHDNAPPAGSDGLVLGFAALSEHDFETAVTALGDLLQEELGEAPTAMITFEPALHHGEVLAGAPTPDEPLRARAPARRGPPRASMNPRRLV